MKTKFNCLLVSACIAVTLFSCKKKNDDVKPTETETPVMTSQEVIFRPKKIFISSDSNIYRLVFENEYDELGRLKTENYYLDTNATATGDGAVNTLYRRELSYADKLISTKSFAKVRYSNYYGQIGWDSSFYDNTNRKLKQKSFSSYQSSFEKGIDSIGANSSFDFTYSTIGDTSIENSKGIRYNQASNAIRHIDKNNVAVKYIDSADCTLTNTYKLETSGSFASRYNLSNYMNNNTRLFSSFELIASCQSFSLKAVTNLNWTFDSQGRPTRLTLVENIEGGTVIKSYYRYEY